MLMLDHRDCLDRQRALSGRRSEPLPWLTPSTKNIEGQREPEMHQTKKGKDWHFGMLERVASAKCPGQGPLLGSPAGVTCLQL